MNLRVYRWQLVASCGMVAAIAVLIGGCPPVPADLCADVTCEEGFACDATTGTCVETTVDLCAGVTCDDGSACDADTGDCVATTEPAEFTSADATRGGSLYDKWWVVAGADEPTGDHAFWATRPDMDSNTREGKDTWRCKECHGWDYKGVDGAYGGGSHKTGFDGIAGTTLSAQEVFDEIKTDHGFGDAGLSDTDVWDVAKFVLQGVIDTDEIIDADGAFTGSAEAGETLYGVCAACHGDDGLSIPPGADDDHDEWVGLLANENPWEFQHKVRFGQPGTPAMPPQADTLTVAEVGDLATHAQTLPTEPGATAERTYVGTDTCLTCHGSTKGNFMDTGHPYKLNAVVDGQPPEYPVTTLAGPPDGIEWADVSFVIGGFRYKYRVVDSDGFIVLGPTAQYNFPTQGRSAYGNDDGHTAPDGTPGPWDENIGRKPYNCGKCHTTGYDADADSHNGLEGIVGDWAFEGIHCEECHGPGSDHIVNFPADIEGDPDTDTVCGKCHTRSTEGIAASGGFIRHHEQWDEFSRTAHASVMTDGCMTCHDVHEPIFGADRLTAIQAAAEAGNMRGMAGLDTPAGIIKECTDCHGSVTVVHAGPDECKVCHMAYTDKSAVAINAYAGDIRSHAWKIEADPDVRMFTDADGNPVDRDDDAVAFAALDSNGRPFITIDFACLQCHTDEDIAWAAENAAGIHGE